jgi:addiction module HigA family antidote
MPVFNHKHPGILLNKWCVKALGLTVTETAKALGVSRKHLSELLNGHAGISAEMAIRLGKAFDTTPEFWINLQKNYELSRAMKKFKAKIPSLTDRKAVAG